jgi:hypothetical protein
MGRIDKPYNFSASKAVWVDGSATQKIDKNAQSDIPKVGENSKYARFVCLGNFMRRFYCRKSGGEYQCSIPL